LDLDGRYEKVETNQKFLNPSLSPSDKSRVSTLQKGEALDKFRFIRKDIIIKQKQTEPTKVPFHLTAIPEEAGFLVVKSFP
jgi:hypothetical protein